MVHTLSRPETIALVLGGTGVGSAVPGIGTVAGAGSGAVSGMAVVNYYKGLGRGLWTEESPWNGPGWPGL
jgi:hypothetical protein